MSQAGLRGPEPRATSSPRDGRAEVGVAAALALGWDRVGGASRPRPPTPPYVLVVYGGFNHMCNSSYVTIRSMRPCCRNQSLDIA